MLGAPDLETCGAKLLVYSINVIMVVNHANTLELRSATGLQTAVITA